MAELTGLPGKDAPPEEQIADAREDGDKRVVLDSLERMGPAVRLYRDLSSRPTEPYSFNPLPGAPYFLLEL